MVDYFLSSIPLWVWVVIGLLTAAPLIYFFGPIWNSLPNWVKWPIYAILTIFGAFAYGRHKGFRDVKKRQEELDRRAVENRKVIHEDVQKLNPVDTDKRLDKWMRD